MKNNKFISIFVAFAAVFFISLSTAYSDSYHSIVYETAPVESTNINNISSEGVALSNALSAIDCNMSSDKWHGGAGAGFYDDSLAPAIGVCKRFGETLMKWSVGVEGGKKGGHVGIMFNFN